MCENAFNYSMHFACKNWKKNSQGNFPSFNITISPCRYIARSECLSSKRAQRTTNAGTMSRINLSRNWISCQGFLR